MCGSLSSGLQPAGVQSFLCLPTVTLIPVIIHRVETKRVCVKVQIRLGELLRVLIFLLAAVIKG